MAMIKCPECGRDISDKAATCPGCGCPINVKAPEGMLILYGYTQSFIIETKIGIFIDGMKVGEVGSAAGSSRVPLQIPITKDCTLTCERPFGRLHKPIIIPIKAGKVTKIKFSWNRITGGLVTQFVDTVTNSDDNTY